MGENNGTDYKKMYLTMVHAAEDAIKIFEKAQLQCEEIYINTCNEEKSEEDRQQK